MVKACGGRKEMALPRGVRTLNEKMARGDFWMGSVAVSLFPIAVSQLDAGRFDTQQSTSRT
jgi:hypothetical protein